MNKYLILYLALLSNINLDQLQIMCVHVSTNMILRFNLVLDLILIWETGPLKMQLLATD